MVRHKTFPRFTGTDWYQCAKAQQGAVTQPNQHKSDQQGKQQDTRPDTSQNNNIGVYKADTSLHWYQLVPVYQGTL
jgi:hypothetical protein